MPPVSFERLLSTRKKRSNTFSRSSSGMPGPVSLTRTTTWPAAPSPGCVPPEGAGSVSTRMTTLPPSWL